MAPRVRICSAESFLDAIFDKRSDDFLREDLDACVDWVGVIEPFGSMLCVGVRECIDDADDDDEPSGSRIELEEEEEPLVHTPRTQQTSDYVVETASDALMLSPTREGFTRHRTNSARSSSRRSVRSALDKGPEGTPNIHGKRLFTTANFWLLFTIASLCELLLPSA